MLAEFKKTKYGKVMQSWVDMSTVFQAGKLAILREETRPVYQCFKLMCYGFLLPF